MAAGWLRSVSEAGPWHRERCVGGVLRVRVLNRAEVEVFSVPRVRSDRGWRAAGGYLLVRARREGTSRSMGVRLLRPDVPRTRDTKGKDGAVLVRFAV